MIDLQETETFKSMSKGLFNASTATIIHKLLMKKEKKHRESSFENWILENSKLLTIFPSSH